MKGVWDYHDGCHDHRAVLHRRAVIGQSIFILDQHEFVNVVPVANLQDTEEKKKKKNIRSVSQYRSINFNWEAGTRGLFLYHRCYSFFSNPNLLLQLFVEFELYVPLD